jgi:ammonium transporter, Amt family
MACPDATGGSCGRSPTNWWYEAGAVIRSYQFWFFQWAFAGAAATIVAGSVCERAKIEAYFVYSIVLTIFIYPVVVHWGWADGFLSPWTSKRGPLFTLDVTKSNGMIDFAGSGVVHMVGGFSGLMGAIITGPRRGRFVDGQVVELYQGNKILQCLGAFILWFGWYGFNCGSTISVSHGMSIVAGKVAMNTTIAAASGAVVSTFLAKFIMGHYDISMGLNGLLAGLVSVTANCAVVEPWHALIIGGVGGIWLYVGHYALLKAKIDDPVDAAVVHGLCGYWGLLCSGIFCTDKNIQFAAYPGTNDACARGEQFGVQVVGGLCIIAWTVGTAGFTFFVINATIGMRVSASMEDEGLDASEHGHASEEPWKGGAAPIAPVMAPQTMLVPMSSMVPPPMMVAPSQPGFDNFSPYGNQGGYLQGGYSGGGGF